MKIIKGLYKIFIVIVILLILSYGGLLLYAKMLPKLPINSANGYYLYDSSGELFYGKKDEWVSLENISPHLINATISIEDKNFYNHSGFDYLRIVKAMMVNIKSGKTLQGASTITQQYAKNLWLDFDKTWKRKLNEAWLTLRLEVHYSKDDILEGYLNTINYGGVYGIENASKYYFNKSAKDLTLEEATILAGIPKSPSNYSPISNPEKAKNRQKLILNAMVDNNYITTLEKNIALNKELTYIGKLEENNISYLHYKDTVIEELKKIKSIPASFIETGGLKIYTTLDKKAQDILTSKINLYIDSDVEIASVILDPNTGAVLALIGGRDYNKSEFNRATKAYRQVGSTIKPFLYYSALENGFTPSTTFTSSRTTFTFSEDKTYSPKNFDDRYPDKQISMMTALAYSDNIYAVKTHLFLGEENLVNMLERVGITKNIDALPSLALGSAEIPLMDMVEGYSTFANEGNKIEAFTIYKVEDVNGNILYEKEIEKENILNKSNVFVLNELLTNCYSNELIDYGNPTCINISSKIDRKYSLKTGTTDYDRWIIGYNPDISFGIWSGYDNNDSPPISVSTQIKNIWIDTAKEYLKDKEKRWYEIPNNVVGVIVDPISGELANENSKKKLTYYIKGTEPRLDNNNLDDSIPTMKEQ